MYKEVRKNNSVYVIKVGANNGLTDPLFNEYCRPNWGGILVEPVPHLFSQLRTNIINPKFKLLLSAVSDVVSIKEFYFIDGDISFLPKWSSQIGSFKREHITKHFTGEVLHKVESLIKCFYVPSITIDSVIDFAEKNIDLLAIDCESCDYNILKSCSFKSSPKYLIFEHIHMTSEQYIDLSIYLNSHNYVEVSKDQFNSKFKLKNLII